MREAAAEMRAQAKRSMEAAREMRASAENAAAVAALMLKECARAGC